MDKLRTVLLIYGGRGYEREVSLSGMKNVLPLIDKNEYKVLPIHIEPDGRWTMEDEEILLARGGIIAGGSFIRVDCAYPLLHGNFGEDGRVQGALDCANISYVGCDTAASALCRDKYIVKIVASSLGIPTLPAVLATCGEDLDRTVSRCEEKIGYPMFIKPTSLGSSIGASGADNKAELAHALKSAIGLCDRVLVEKRLTRKKELECGFLGINSKELFTNPGEIFCDSFYDYDKKYLPGGAKACPNADVDEATGKKIKEYSSRLTHALGVRDLARIDFFLSDEGIYFNEINTMPGQTATSLYFKMIEAEGIPTKSLLRSLIDGAIRRG